MLTIFHFKSFLPVSTHIGEGFNLNQTANIALISRETHDPKFFSALWKSWYHSTAPSMFGIPTHIYKVFCMQIWLLMNQKQLREQKQRCKFRGCLISLFWLHSWSLNYMMVQKLKSFRTLNIPWVYSHLRGISFILVLNFGYFFFLIAGWREMQTPGSNKAGRSRNWCRHQSG